MVVLVVATWAKKLFFLNFFYLLSFLFGQYGGITEGAEVLASSN